MLLYFIMKEFSTQYIYFKTRKHNGPLMLTYHTAIYRPQLKVQIGSWNMEILFYVVSFQK